MSRVVAHALQFEYLVLVPYIVAITVTAETMKKRKSPANKNTEAVRRCRARQDKRKKDRLKKAVKRSSNSEYRKREREADRIQTAERRGRDPDVKKKEREAIADRRNNEP